MQVRFRDPLVWLGDFAAADIDVVCPRCSARAVVTAAAGGTRRFVCAGCARTDVWSSRGGVWYSGGAVDPFFRLPLWLRAECCGGRTLWALNERHLRFLEEYIAAELRERGWTGSGMTLAARLPAWLKAARNRAPLLRAIARLRAA